jgi:hypothetical protein
MACGPVHAATKCPWVRQRPPPPLPCPCPHDPPLDPSPASLPSPVLRRPRMPATHTHVHTCTHSRSVRGKALLGRAGGGPGAEAGPVDEDEPGGAGGGVQWASLRRLGRGAVPRVGPPLSSPPPPAPLPLHVMDATGRWHTIGDSSGSGSGWGGRAGSAMAAMPLGVVGVAATVCPAAVSPAGATPRASRTPSPVGAEEVLASHGTLCETLVVDDGGLGSSSSSGGGGGGGGGGGVAASFAGRVDASLTSLLDVCGEVDRDEGDLPSSPQVRWAQGPPIGLRGLAAVW